MGYVAPDKDVKEWLDSLRVGDKVSVKDSRNIMKPLNAIITKKTRKHIYANHNEFSKNTGKSYFKNMRGDFHYLSKRD